MNYEIATENDIKELFDLQKNAFETEAELTGSRNIPALMESYEKFRSDFEKWTVLLTRNEAGRIIGAVRFQKDGGHIDIGRLMVAQEWRNRGIASGLMHAVEDFSKGKMFELFTCTKSLPNIKLYKKLGYASFKIEPGTEDLSFVYMRKRIREQG